MGGRDSLPAPNKLLNKVWGTARDRLSHEGAGGPQAIYMTAAASEGETKKILGGAWARRWFGGLSLSS